MAALDGGRIGIGAQSVGIAQGAIDETLNMLKKENSSANQSANSRTHSSNLLNARQRLMQQDLWYGEQLLQKTTMATTLLYAAMCKLLRIRCSKRSNKTVCTVIRRIRLLKRISCRKNDERR